MVMNMNVTAVCTLNCTVMMENKQQIFTVSIHTVTTETGALKTCNSTGLHTAVKYFSSYTTNRQLTVNADTPTS